MDKSLAVSPSNYDGDGDASISTSALSVSSSIDAIKDSSAALSLIEYVDEEEDEDVCRICRNPGDTDNPLRFPCSCRGSIKYVHQDCLLQWLIHSKAHQCEVCKHRFDFSPIYAENAPTKLPFHEFIVAMAKKTYHIIQFFLRLCLVFFVWFLTIPYTIYLIYRLAFVRSFSEVQRLFLSHIFTTNILTDCLFGFLVSVTLAIILFGMTFIRDYFKIVFELGGQDSFEAQNKKLLDDIRNLDGDDKHLVKNQMIQRIKSETDQMFQRIEQILDELDDDRMNRNAQIGEMIQILEQINQKLEELRAELVDEENELVNMVHLNLHRIACQRMSHFIDQIRQIQRNVPFAELVGLQGQVFRFVLYAFSVLGRNIYTIGVVIFVPLCLGRVILHYLFSKESSNLVTIGVGYMVISSLFFLYFVILELIRYKRGKPLIMGRLHLHFHALFKQFVSSMRYSMSILKVFLLVIIYFGVVPFTCGWCIDPSTKGLFGESFAQKLKFFTVSPFARVLVHWMVGFVYMVLITILFRLLREVLRNEVVNFRGAPEDPNFKLRDLIDEPMHKHAHRVLMGSVVRLSFIVMVGFLSVKLSMWIAPSIFPLNITIYNPFTEIPVEMLLYQICMPFTIPHFKSLLYYWFTIVGYALGLTQFLLPRPDDDNGQNEKQVVTNFVFRIVVLLILAWMTLLVFTTGLIILPVSLGRSFFTLISFFPIINGFKFNDVYAFIMGSYVIWGIVGGVKYCIEHIKTTRAKFMWKNIRKWSVILIKSSVLLSIWILVIPVLIGLLLQLSLNVPMWVPLDETLYEKWCVGVISLKIWTTLVIPWMDDTWQAKLERVRENGFARVECIWVLREIIVPIMKKLIIALCVPYVLARGVFPVFGFSLVINSLVYRFAWLGCFGLCLVWYCVKRLIVWFSNLHIIILNERYLIGCTLHDFGEDKGESQLANETATSSPENVCPAIQHDYIFSDRYIS